jgi:hypothetical protein
VAIVLASVLIASCITATEARAHDLLRNNGFEHSTYAWDGWLAKVRRVTPGLASRGAGRIAKRGGHRVAAVRQSAIRETIEGALYRARASARARSRTQLCLRLVEYRNGSSVGRSRRCARATGGWEALPGVAYTARRTGDRLVLSVRAYGPGRTVFRVDRVSLRKVKSITNTQNTEPGTFIKLLDSTNATDISCFEGNGSMARGGLGDTFYIPEQPSVQTSRCTWVNTAFSQMERHESFDIDLRWDQYAQADSSHAGIIYIRPNDPNLASGCDGGGNRDNIIVRLYVEWAADPDQWMVDLRGGESPWPIDEDPHTVTVPLGPVVQGEVVNFKFDLFFDDAHGAVAIWRNGARVFEELDRPLGFHYNCSYRTSATGSPEPGATDISNYRLRVQHGIYRNTTPAWQLTSSGFHFYCSQTSPC